jgi:hypothetical protein
MITSGIDSLDVHKVGSWHGQGRAIGGLSHTEADVACIRRELPRRLPRAFESEGQYQLIWETPRTHKTNAPHWHLAFVPNARFQPIKASTK